MHLSQDIIDYLKKDDGTIIMISESGEPIGVFLTFKTYAKLREKEFAPQKIAPSHRNGLTSDELLDKINLEIAQWKESQNPNSLEASSFTQEKKTTHKQKDEEESIYLETIDD